MIPPAWLRRVPGCADGSRAESVSRLAGGSAHQTWRVRTQRGEFVLRAPDPALPDMAQRDFARECQLQQLAAAAGMAPRIVHIDANERVIVMEYVAGRLWTHADFSRPERLRALCACLERLHTVCAPALVVLDPVANAARYAQAVLRAAPNDASLIRARLAAASVAWRRCQIDARAPAVVHCDIHATNVIDRAGGAAQEAIVLLDWEYAQVGDPLLDFAALCAYYPEAQATVGDWLSRRDGVSTVMARRLGAASAIFRLLGWLWYRARALQAPTGADVDAAAALEQGIDAGLAEVGA